MHIPGYTLIFQVFPEVPQENMLLVFVLLLHLVNILPLIFHFLNVLIVQAINFGFCGPQNVRTDFSEDGLLKGQLLLE